MPTLFARILLFISSYTPLFAIFGFLYLRKSPQVSVIFFLVAILGLLGLLGFLQYFRNKKSPENLTVSRFCPRDEQSMSYIVSYIIPFLSISTATWEQQAALAVFFAMIGILYVNTNMIHINPTLSFLGYRFYEVTNAKGSVHTLINKGALDAPGTIGAACAGQHLYVESKKK